MLTHSFYTTTWLTLNDIEQTSVSTYKVTETGLIPCIAAPANPNGMTRLVGTDFIFKEYVLVSRAIARTNEYQSLWVLL